MLIGNKNPAWKGNKAGYKAIHMWVNKHKGKPKKCSKCGSKKNVEWANVDGKYKRKLGDYIAMCKKCHIKYDWTDEWSKNISKAQKDRKRKRDKFGRFL